MTGCIVAIILAFTGMIYVASIGMAIGLFKLADEHEQKAKMLYDTASLLFDFTI